jgi:hypothetical protein
MITNKNLLKGTKACLNTHPAILLLHADLNNEPDHNSMQVTRSFAFVKKGAFLYTVAR